MPKLNKVQIQTKLKELFDSSLRIALENKLYPESEKEAFREDLYLVVQHYGRPEDTALYRNKKTKRIYMAFKYGIKNATTAQADQEMVLYKDGKNQYFVRSYKEFEKKFELMEASDES